MPAGIKNPEGEVNIQADQVALRIGESAMTIGMLKEVFSRNEKVVLTNGFENDVL